MNASTSSTAEHLCVLVHGLWGKPEHLNYLRDTLQAQQPEDRLHILVAKSNANSFTYDGIAIGGERITHEIEQTIQKLEHNGTKIKKISIVGYSLGGLVSRYAIGLLYKNGIFENIEPVNFTTFATPHLGIKTPKLGYGSQIWNTLGSRTLSTSGQQMFLVDNFRESGRPLLSIMTDKDSIFIEGLRLFKNKTVYANTLNDRSVPYYTASISRHDPFVDLDKVDVHYLPDQPDPVLLDPANPVSLRKSKEQQALTTYSERFSLISAQTRTTLPFYALLFTLLPIAVPTFLVNSVIQTYRSVQRTKLHEAGQAGISLGRYQIPMLEKAQGMQDRMVERLASESGEDYLPTPPPEPSSSSSSTKSLEKAQTTNDASSSPFPKLALCDEQFEMIDSLDSVGFVKFPAHIQKHRHTHAAIVVRMDKPGFEEGKAVVRHWAEEFEV